ncbi:ATP-binding protein [Alicyclobacillus fodiniaquatilis]|uniref:ATP-binding protein n=1 Tax=Alicyclobacillus fodiniaquatilis TaxID=1661150 RepID=A0ABW4JKR6_9BACL
MPTRIEGNLAWIDQRPWAFYKLVPYSYEPLSEAEKEAQFAQSERFFRHIQEADYHVYMWQVRRRFDWERYLSDLAESAQAPFRAAADEVTGYWAETIYGSHALPDYDTIIALELPFQIVRKYRFLTQTFGIPTRWVEQMMGLGGKSIFREEREGAQIRERNLLNRVNNLLPAVPLDAVEVADFYRHHFWRGFNMKGLPEKLRRLWPKGEQDHTWLSEGLVIDRLRHLELVQGEEKQYVAFVTMASVPDELTIPGQELFYRMLTQRFPVESMVRWKHIAPKQAMRIVKKKKLDVKDAAGHVAEVDDVPLSVLEKQEVATALELHMQHTRPPLLDSRVAFCVEAESEEELQDYTETIIDLLDDFGFVGARPTGEQVQLFESWLPSSKWTGYGYKLQLLPQVAGAMTMPGASSILGDPNGIPVGFSGRGGVVKLDLARGPQMNKSASVVLTGTLGSGKSFTLNTLLYYAALIWGARIFIVDPKSERSHWPGVLPGLENQIRTIVLDGRRNPGALDPFRLMEDKASAAEVSVSILSQLLQMQHREEELILLEAAKQTRELKNPSMADLLRIVQALPDDKSVGKWLQQVADLPLGQLIFGTWNNEQSPLPDSGMVILQLANLTLPQDGKKAENLRERASVAVMTATAILAESFILHGKGGFRLAALDEAWTWLRSAEGKALADRLERAGRSSNAGIWISTQNPSDVSPDLLNNVSSYICLGTNNDKETELAISALGLQPTDDLKKSLQVRVSMGQDEDGRERTSGRGFLRDLDGRAGFLEFYTPHPVLRKVFNTTPEAVEASKVKAVGGK